MVVVPSGDGTASTDPHSATAGALSVGLSRGRGQEELTIDRFGLIDRDWGGNSPAAQGSHDGKREETGELHDCGRGVGWVPAEMILTGGELD